MADQEVKEVYPFRVFDNGLPVDADFRPVKTVNPITEVEPEVAEVEPVVVVEVPVPAPVAVIDPVTDTIKSENPKAAARD